MKSVMKSVLTTALLLLAAGPATAACPQLAGSYQCRGTTTSYDGVITQGLRDGKMNYAVVLGDSGAAMRFAVIADGVRRTEKKDGSVFATTAVCSGGGLDVTLDMSNAKDRYRLVTATKWRRIGDRTLKVEYHAVEMDRGSEMEYDERFLCTRR
ncbi:MAG: hypothetical protein NDI61_05685 [Bdellovibrionaceae bacterium]|nr:hypothetical protein [Pseudobdellovibrionaceae bacterium]